VNTILLFRVKPYGDYSIIGAKVNLLNGVKPQQANATYNLSTPDYGHNTDNPEHFTNFI